MLKGDPISVAASDPEWQPLIQTKVELTKQCSCNNNAFIFNSNYEDTLFLNSYASFNSKLDRQNRRYPLFRNPLIVPVENLESQKPRGFIDAWSNAETGENNNDNAKKSPVSPDGKLSLYSLDLSMGGGGGSVVDEEMVLGLMVPDGNTENGNKSHLRPSAVAAANEAASNPPSPIITNFESSSPLATMVSSPSRVLPKTLASMPDGSSNSSPTVAFSRANSKIALLLFNKAN